MQVDNEVLEAAHLLLRPLCLRRLKEEVETTLPPRVRDPLLFLYVLGDRQRSLVLRQRGRLVAICQRKGHALSHAHWVHLPDADVFRTFDAF